jgi:hypothetical protein
MMRRLIYLATLCVACSSCAALGDQLTFESSTPPSTSGAGGQETNTSSGRGDTALHTTYRARNMNYPPPGRGLGPDYY